jgi:hypothetical protein
MIENLNDVDEITINTLRVLDVLNRKRAKGHHSPSVESVLKEAFGKIRAVAPTGQQPQTIDDADIPRTNRNDYAG